MLNCLASHELPPQEASPSFDFFFLKECNSIYNTHFVILLINRTFCYIGFQVCLHAVKQAVSVGTSVVKHTDFVTLNPLRCLKFTL